MQDFLTFFSVLMTDISDFLLSEPIVWFVGIMLLFVIVRLFKYIICTN